MSGRMSGHNSREIRHRERALAAPGGSATAVLALDTRRPGRLHENGYAQPRVAAIGETDDLPCRDALPARRRRNVVRLRLQTCRAACAVRRGFQVGEAGDVPTRAV